MKTYPAKWNWTLYHKPCCTDGYPYLLQLNGVGGTSHKTDTDAMDYLATHLRQVVTERQSDANYVDA